MLGREALSWIVGREELLGLDCTARINVKLAHLIIIVSSGDDHKQGSDEDRRQSSRSVIIVYR